MQTGTIATRNETKLTFNVGQRVEYRGVYLRIEAEIVALDYDKRGNPVVLLKPVSGVNMWRDLDSIRPMGVA